MKPAGVDRIENRFVAVGVQRSHAGGSGYIMTTLKLKSSTLVEQ